MQWCNGGAYAELATAPEAALAAKPVEVSFVAAACVPTAGPIVLSNLPGSVGSLAVQIAKARGATVVGVDLGDRVDLASRAGAGTVIDAGSVDFTRTGDRYDVIIDIPGNHRLSDCRRALTSDGVYVLIGHDAFGAHGGRWLGSLRRFAGLLVRTPFSPHLQPSFSAPPKQGWDALRHLVAGRARGRVVLVP